ncbi:MAG: isoprenylcysteine carboxylmethyltransferase family protein [Phycisphaeraceae bacterium]|nr:isoprenylcysteine carboxylmethyltransferase family protein [Phycisphaeraceae bacterium]
MSQTTGSQCPFSIMAQRITDRSQRIGTLAYGLAAYALFFVTLLYAVAWVGGWFVPKTINSGVAGPLVPSLLVNALLLSLFVVQHTVMARPAFKRWWVRIIPHAIERSTFVIAASLSLLAVFLLWRPAPATVWHVTDTVPAAAITGLCLAGWGLVLFSSFVINHCDLFGLRQVWLRYTGRPQTPVGFRLAGPYKLVRHPLMVGFLIAFWATPHMTVGHLFFAVMTTGYIFMGIWFEERDLVAEHGEAYLRYRRSVRALLPIPRAAPGGKGRSVDER